jgi:hypothetical protein
MKMTISLHTNFFMVPYLHEYKMLLHVKRHPPQLSIFGNLPIEFKVIHILRNRLTTQHLIQMTAHTTINNYLLFCDAPAT